MQFEIILATIGLLYVYQRFMIEPDPESKKYKIQDTWLDRKPFNCIFCISWWLGLTLSVLYLNFLYIAVPLLYRIIQLKLIR